MKIRILSLLALFAVAFAAPVATAQPASAESITADNAMQVIRQEARWVVRRVCRPYRRCFTRYRVYRRPIYRTVCRRYRMGNRWHRRCVRRVVGYRTYRRPYRVCRVFRRCYTRRVWVR
jgi:Ni/Co efflux regulator RcnB